jgi:hypothetical protein
MGHPRKVQYFSATAFHKFFQPDELNPVVSRSSATIAQKSLQEPTATPTPQLSAQYFFHLPALRQFIDQFVQIPYLPSQRMLDLLNSIPTAG